MDQEGGSTCSMWAPGSPRLSFSRDFVQSDVFNPSALQRQQLQDPSDFDFGMLALLRTDGAAAADELFQNGKLLPIDSARNRLHEEEIDAAAPAIVGIHPEVEEEQAMCAHESSSSSRIQKEEQQLQQQQQQQQQIPKSPSNRWKELFGLSRRSSLRSSSSSSSASISETEPLNASLSSCSGASCSKPSKLKLLFRSSSAGAGRRHQAAQEPSLGRSASESKVSSCCNDLHLQVVEASNADLLIRSRATGPHVGLADHPSIHASSSETGEEKVPKRQQQPQHDLARPAMKKNTAQRRNVPKSGGSQEQQQQQQQQRRKALAEMKGSSRTTNRQNCCLNPSQQNHHSHHQEKLQQKSHHKNTSSSSSSIDAWRVYSERMSNASSVNAGSKVAEVLHMEVCMGQSMVVSRVAKAFKNQNHHHGSTSSSSSSAVKFVGVAAKGT